MYRLNEDGKVYKDLLKKYLESNDKTFLNEAKKMSVSFVSRNMYPEDIFKLHKNAISSICEGVEEVHHKSLEFLLESLIAYQNAQEEYEKLKLEQLELKSEIQIAANMQKTFLKTEIPHIEGLDIGAISVPYHQLNGDYMHFVETDDGSLRVAIADVIGKGIPAALAMSMIKYAIDSFYEDDMSPKTILRKLNRVVEKNVTSNMFITMFYGQYYPCSSIFRFASAGHEPGFIFRAKEKKFVEIGAKGLVLGVLKNTHYNQYETKIEKGDMIILLTDGVTECRTGNRFIKREEVLEVIEQYAHLPAQQHVEKVYMHFNDFNQYELKDDFTLIIIKKLDQ